jgi:hypothetical protein
MKCFKKMKDGGPTSPVNGYFLFEIKNLCSIALLKFNKGGREAFHTHAFTALTWFLCGNLVEEDIDGSTYTYSRSILPKLTKKDKNHRVKALEDSWCFTIRGPWSKYWTEDNKTTNKKTTFTHGRVVVNEEEMF